MNILNVLVQYLNGAYVAEYAPERGEKMLHSAICNQIQCLVERCYFNHVGRCEYCFDAETKDRPVKMVVIAQTGNCAMMRLPKGE